jgi:hypothetical protein
MTRLLRPGIHSGTVPKLFAKLRRAERRAHAGADRRAAVKRLRAIRRVEMAVRRFVERELLELLGHARPRESYAVMLGPIHLATNRIRILLDRPAAAGRPLEVAVEMRSGWLVARILRPGWTEQLAPAERRVLEAALAGFYKLAGVELISEQLRAALPPPSEFDITGDGLVVDEEDGKTRVLYRLRHEGPIEPQVVRGEPWRTLPTLSPSDLLFSCVPIPWDRWVEFWQNAQSDHAPTSDPIAAARILPRS